MGHKRWRYMFKGRKQGKDQFQVDLTTQHSEIKYSSRRNIAWNWRTLLLMKRTGFIELYFKEPQLPQEDEMTDGEIIEYFLQYYSHVEVQILRDGHLSQKVWEEQIGTQRFYEHSIRSNGFNKLKEWLDRPETNLCGLLANFYATKGYLPENSCGGCPGCREEGRGPLTPTLGSIVQYVEGFKKTENAVTGEVRRIHYKGKGQSIRVLLHKWKHLISFLLKKEKIQAIRARSDVHEILNRILPVDAFWCSIRPGEPDSLWRELILVSPDESEVPNAGLSDNDKIFFIPDHLKDLKHPHRVWVDCDQHAISIEDYEKELRYVDY